MSNTLQNDAWLEERRGYITSSRLGDVLSNNYAYAGQLAQERNGAPIMQSTSRSMERGQLMEEVAIRAYEAIKANKVTPCAFIKHTSIRWFGGTPDGLVQKNGLIEVKCLTDGRKIKNIKRGLIPVEYILQCAGNILVTNRQWCDFVLFCPQLEAKEAIYIKRITRKDFNEDHIIKRVLQFNERVEHERAELG